MTISRRSIITVSLGAVLGCGAVACASQQGSASSDNTTSGSTAGSYLDDAAITTKVKAALVSDVGAKAATDVTVTTEGGVVQLAGFAASRDEANRAVAAAKKVGGVRDVKDDIRLK